MDETWKQIHLPDFPEYEVSNLGRIRRIARFVNCEPRVAIVGSYIFDEGYLKAHIYSRSTGANLRKTVFVHVLVAHAFVPGYAPKLVVHHKDENKANARADNLQWVTRSQNLNAISHQQWSQRVRISDGEAELIRQCIKIGLSLRQAGRAFQISPTYTSRIVRGLAHPTRSSPMGHTPTETPLPGSIPSKPTPTPISPQYAPRSSQ